MPLGHHVRLHGHCIAEQFAAANASHRKVYNGCSYVEEQYTCLLLPPFPCASVFEPTAPSPFSFCSSGIIAQDNVKDPSFEKVHVEQYGGVENDFFDEWEVSYETNKAFASPVYSERDTCEGGHMLMMGASNVSFTVSQTVTMTAELAAATHMSFLLSVVQGDHSRVMPTLFVSFGGTAVLVHAGLVDVADRCVVVNVRVPDAARARLGEPLRISFRTVSVRASEAVAPIPFTVLVDSIRFVTLRDGTGAAVETPSHPVVAGQCAPGCEAAAARTAGVYYPACDTAGCGYATRELDPYARVVRADVCANQVRPGPVYESGVCSMYNGSSCCRTRADEDGAYARAQSTIDAHCDFSAAPDCARELGLVRCALCHPSSSLYVEGGSVKLCTHYADDVYGRCARHCPGIAAASAAEFFAATGLGVLYGNTRTCFNGADTGAYFLLRTELIHHRRLRPRLRRRRRRRRLCRAPSAKVATTVDDKYEPDPDAVGAASAAPFEDQSVAMQSVAAPTASVDMVNGGLNSKAMMMTGAGMGMGAGTASTAAAGPNAFMSANFDPALQQTQGGPGN